MNGIFALCHFCEQHGPRILACTQAFHSSEDAGATSTTEPEHMFAEEISFVNTLTDRISKEERQRRVSSKDSISTVGTQNTLLSSASQCRMCGWNETVPGFISHDRSATTLYLTTHRTQQSELYSAIQRACVRSISCEVCPGREGPLLFGDPEHGFVFSYSFSLPDRESRGFLRWYSVVMLMADHLYLVNSWHFLTNHIGMIVADLKTKAAASNSKVTVQPSSRLSGHAPISRNPFLRRPRATNPKPLRSLSELVGETDTLPNIHAYFTWVLKGCCQRMFERQVEGPTRLGIPKPLPILDDSSEGCVQSLRQLQDAMEPGHFELVLFNAIVGNQVIVRGKKTNVVNSILCALSQLIPANCCDMLIEQSSYRESYECNLLGIPVGKGVPPHVRPDTFLLVDASLRKDTKRADPNARRLLFVLHAASLNMAEAAKGNSLLTELSNMYAQQDNTEAVDSQWLENTRDKWMMYAKAYFKFMHRPTEGVQGSIIEFLHALGLREEDLPVLRFFCKGLSRSHRVKLLRAQQRQAQALE